MILPPIILSRNPLSANGQAGMGKESGSKPERQSSGGRASRSRTNAEVKTKRKFIFYRRSYELKCCVQAPASECSSGAFAKTCLRIKWFSHQIHHALRAGAARLLADVRAHWADIAYRALAIFPLRLRPVTRAFGRSLALVLMPGARCRHGRRFDKRQRKNDDDA
jgi:hypothetical protein